MEKHHNIFSRINSAITQTMKKILTSPRKFLLPAAVLILLAFLGISLTQKPTAPDVTFTTLDGQKIELSALRDKVVLVNFWATDCPGCIAEMPMLIETYKQYHERGFEIIAVAMSYDPPSRVLNYTTKNALPFPVMHDGFGEIAKSFDDVSLTPTAFIIDKQGQIISHVVGELDFAALRATLEQKLSKPPTSNAAKVDNTDEKAAS